MVGGLVGSSLMVEFQRRAWPPPKGDNGSSTTRLARELAGWLGSGPLTDERAQAAGSLIHYTLGAGLGLAYGALASARPAVAKGAGLPFGAATEIVIDQTLVPALGLSNPFWKCSPERHLRGMAAHLVFGAATEATRRLLIAFAGRAARPESGRA